MSSEAPILVVTDSPADATFIGELLAGESTNIFTSTDSRFSVSDFERIRPAVLILAFNSLEKADTYYSELNRQSQVARMLPRQTVILCSQRDVLRVSALCKQQHFDDYVLFWPVSNDPGRLSTTVHRALRQITEANTQNLGEIATQARRIGELEQQLDQYTASANEQIDTAGQSLARAAQEIGVALDDFSETITAGRLNNVVEVKDRVALRNEFDRLKREDIDGPLKAASSAVQPVRRSVGSLKGHLAPQLESARALKLLAASIRPLLLIIDDDEFQHQLLRALFVEEAFELAFATSSAGAISVMRRRRPDLILMDIDLPDVDGVETTRQLKAVKQFAEIPIVMITGHGAKDVIIASMNAGASDFVVKPFSKATIIAKVRRILGIETAIEPTAPRSETATP